MTAEIVWVATFYEQGKPPNKIKFDILESGGQSYLLNPRGTGSFPFTKIIQWDGKSWELESTDQKPSVPPQPRDPVRESAIQNLETALKRFPTHDALLLFYAGEPLLEGKINHNYDLTPEEMNEWVTKITNILAGPKFTQEQLRIKFTGQTIGPHLYIAE